MMQRIEQFILSRPYLYLLIGLTIGCTAAALGTERFDRAAISYLMALTARICLPGALIPVPWFRIFGGTAKYHFQQAHRLDVYRSILLYGTAILFLFGTAFLAIDIEALVF